MVQKFIFFAFILCIITPTFVFASKDSPVALDAATIKSLKEIITSYEAQMRTDDSVSLSLVNAEDYQLFFDIVAKGTKLEGYTLNNGQFIFTDGKEGVDTVIYKNRRADYTLYRGNDIPSLGYKNVSIVKGKKDNFVQIDVNSELYQFKDKQVSIPDFKTVSKRVKKEDLTIENISLSYPNGIGHGSNGSPVPDQKISVIIKNNEFGLDNQSGKKIKYLAELYEISDRKSKKTGIKFSGEATRPGKEESVTFDFFIAGGLPIDDDINPKMYGVKISIDTSNKVREIDEKNNTYWSDIWVVTYDKG